MTKMNAADRAVAAFADATGRTDEEAVAALTLGAITVAFFAALRCALHVLDLLDDLDVPVGGSRRPPSRSANGSSLR
jgi:hypothetical protein